MSAGTAPLLQGVTQEQQLSRVLDLCAMENVDAIRWQAYVGANSGSEKNKGLLVTKRVSL